VIWCEVGVLYHRHYVCTLMHNLGFAFQKARFVSDPLDEAKRRKALIRFEDEASFAQGGLPRLPLVEGGTAARGSHPWQV